ncbi:hypothetical protein SPFM9_00194 [Salmonella phage SPFM9]|nr:hypothetical protein SPFM9_00194 [Salmonella phage SPFM9]
MAVEIKLADLNGREGFNQISKLEDGKKYYADLLGLHNKLYDDQTIVG